MYHWLLKKSQNPDLSFDVLQETFLKALQLQNDFCQIEHPKAWVFRVAHNLLIDWYRKQSKFIDWQETLDCQETTSPSPHTALLLPGYNDGDNRIFSPDSPSPAIDSLAQCLPKALLKLSPTEKAIIEACDLSGVKQAEFAKQQQLSLAATKARLKRARKKLKLVLKTQCRIQFDEHQKVCCFFPTEYQNK